MGHSAEFGYMLWPTAGFSYPLWAKDLVKGYGPRGAVFGCALAQILERDSDAK
jgi:hypothetical protein